MEIELKSAPYRNATLSIDERVEDLLHRMTLEEKTAQTISYQHLKFEEDGSLAEETRAKLKHGLGSFQKGTGKLPPRESAQFANMLQRFMVEETRLGIPILIHEECLHGHLAVRGTSFPQALALASTWDPDLVEQVFTTVARETRARGAHQALTPNCDIARDPRFGRVEETYGEDACLNARMVAAVVRGFQGRGPGIGSDRIISTLKHFAGYGQGDGGRNFAPSSIPLRVFLDEIIQPFRAGIEAGAMSVMPAHGELDGIPCHANRWLLTDLLREELGFDGYVVTDYHDIQRLKIIHRIIEKSRGRRHPGLAGGRGYGIARTARVCPFDRSRAHRPA